MKKDRRQLKILKTKSVQFENKSHIWMNKFEYLSSLTNKKVHGL